MHIKISRSIIALFVFIAPFAFATVASAQTSGEPIGYVTENGKTRALTASEASLSATTLTPAEMKSSTSQDADIVHPVPEIPINVDGVLYAPEEISRFNGQVLFYVLDQHTEREGVMVAFTSEKGLMEYLKEQWSWEPGSGAGGGVQLDSDSYWTVFYSDAYYAGSTIISAPGAAISNLGNISPGWNDRISSVSVSTGAAWATLYVDINYGGDQLWMQRGTEWGWLLFNGWDDRASSLKVWQN